MGVMRYPLLIAVAVSLFVAMLATAAPPPPPPANDLDNYEPGPDSKPQPGVPRGKQFSFAYEGSKIFPGTRRTISVYVPAQYKPDKSACVYVGLDGLGFGVPVVFDNLIHKGEMPVTIAIGVSPGTAIAATGDEKEDPRFNRSFEFDGLNDQLARCIAEEIFPEVERRKTPDGLEIKLSRDPNDHCAGGGSTGGIGAFTLAWERPDLFRRVFSAIGTFVGMRGGDRYPVLVRKTEPKPIRVFQQDGENDQWGGGPEVGDWWMSNVTLDRALEFGGYEHQHVWGTGPHSGKHATAIFPDAMRYLWKDYPKPIEPQTARTQNVLLKATLDPAAQWEQVKEAGEHCEGLATKPGGEVVFYDTAARRSRRIKTDGSVADDDTGQPVLAFTAEGHPLTAAPNTTRATATNTGNLYLTQTDSGKVWLLKPDNSSVMLDEGLKAPTAIALSPDGLWLAVFESRTHWGYSYRIKADGGVDLKQRFYWAHVPDTADDSGAAQACMDRDGHPYVATNMGVQIFDRNGRSRGILPMPAAGGNAPAAATAVCFGGEKYDTLYAISAGRIWKRHMKATGAPGFLPPIKLPPWGAG